MKIFVFRFKPYIIYNLHFSTHGNPFSSEEREKTAPFTGKTLLNPGNVLFLSEMLKMFISELDRGMPRMSVIPPSAVSLLEHTDLSNTDCCY